MRSVIEVKAQQQALSRCKGTAMPCSCFLAASDASSHITTSDALLPNDSLWTQLQQRSPQGEQRCTWFRDLQCDRHGCMRPPLLPCLRFCQTPNTVSCLTIGLPGVVSKILTEQHDKVHRSAYSSCKPSLARQAFFPPVLCVPRQLQPSCDWYWLDS